MYRFRASETFWKKFYRLSPDQKKSVWRAWEIFRLDPFDSRLGTHKIANLSARYRKIIYSVVIEADLRAVFYVEGDIIWTVDLGSHSVYR